jgi:hypothetical protein
MRATVAIILIWLSSSCEQPSSRSGMEPLRLIPLSPYQYEFSNQYGKNRIDYFFTKHDYQDNPGFREKLDNLIKKIKSKIDSKYNLYSIYVYKKTTTINENFSGDNNDLRGVYNNDLISYSRWNQGNIDIFYFIEDGKVVFDMIKNDRVSPSWEFD